MNSTPASRPVTLRPGSGRLLKMLNREILFTRRWQLTRPGAEVEDRRRAEGELVRLTGIIEAPPVCRPVARFRFFPATVTAEGLLLRSRAEAKPHRLAVGPGFLKSAGPTIAKAGFVALQLATLGEPAARKPRRLAAQGRVTDSFLLHGLTAELTETLAEYSQQAVMKRTDWLSARRISPGYPVWPQLADNALVLSLLGAETLGVRLTETFQMVPVYSTTALIVPR